MYHVVTFANGKHFYRLLTDCIFGTTAVMSLPASNTTSKIELMAVEVNMSNMFRHTWDSRAATIPEMAHRTLIELDVYSLLKRPEYAPLNEYMSGLNEREAVVMHVRWSDNSKLHLPADDYGFGIKNPDSIMWFKNSVGPGSLVLDIPPIDKLNQQRWNHIVHNCSSSFWETKIPEAVFISREIHLSCSDTEFVVACHGERNGTIVARCSPPEHPEKFKTPMSIDSNKEGTWVDNLIPVKVSASWRKRKKIDLGDGEVKEEQQPTKKRKLDSSSSSATEPMDIDTTVQQGVTSHLHLSGRLLLLVRCAKMAALYTLYFGSGCLRIVGACQTKGTFVEMIVEGLKADVGSCTLGK